MLVVGGGLFHRGVNRTVAMLRRTIKGVEPKRLGPRADHIVAGALRDDDPVIRLHGVTNAVASMGTALTEITLNPLSEADSRQLVANLLEIEALPENIRDIILKKAEGNPFFVEEVIRMLIDRGAIVRKDDQRWAAGKEIETMEIPDNLQGLLLARIDRLPDDVKRTLRVASVIGRQFPVKVLEQVLGTG